MIRTMPPPRPSWLVHTYYVLAGNTPVLVHNVNEADVCLQTLGAGPYAVEGVSTPRRNVTARHPEYWENQINGIAHGCHTCGARLPGTPNGRWIFDHQPPISTVNGPYKGTGYPHCDSCRAQQGGIASQLSQGNYDFPREVIDARHLNLITLD
jgi:hypothetical protein